MQGMNTNFTLLGMWASMNWVARGVVIVLAFMSMWSLAVAIERLWRFRNAKRESVALAREVTPLLQHHHLADAMAKARDERFRSSYLARILRAGLAEFQVAAVSGMPEEFDVVDAGRRAIERETLITVADLRRGIGSLGSISTTAPFIGLFGTVIGIIHSFQGMVATGSGGLGAVSAGIAEALVTTAFGLLVAIPAVLLYNLLVGIIGGFQVEMASTAAQLVDFFIKNSAKAKTARA